MTNTGTKDLEYVGGFDYLRVFFMMAVVAWHTKLFGMTNLFQSDPGKFSVGLVDVLYLNVCLVGIPVFFLISLFLYVRGRKTKPKYAQKRLRYLIVIFLFWILIDSIVNLGQIVNSNMLSFRYYYNGGTNSTLWFIFCLIILTLTTELGIRLKDKIDEVKFLKIQWILFLTTTLLWLFDIPIFYLVPEQYKDLWISFRNPISFLPYVFLVFILMYYYNNNLITIKNSGLKKLLILLSVIIIPLVYCEWELLPNMIYAQYTSVLTPIYTRLSLLITTIVVFLVFIMRDYRPPKVIKDTSELTLGIYIIHWFIWTHLNTLFGALIPYVSIDKIPVVRFLVVLFTAAGLSYFLKKERVI